MAVKINFDTANRPEPPTFILAKKSGERLGVIDNVTDIHFSDFMNAASEISFTVHKTLNTHTCSLWDDLQDLKIIYVNEWKKWFEINVSLDEDTETTKSISGTSMQESELSNAYLFQIEINTEDDIKRDDYVATPLFNPDTPTASVLHRILADKGQNYVINHVDDTIAKLQRTFTFDNTYIYDALQEISKELNCLFVFGEENNASSMQRTISAYDLESNCNDCGYRGEFTLMCPECGSTDILEGYGNDTNIFISSENLANGINYTTDIGSVKNCFRLEAGDDLMTATVINANPSGTQYLWCITDKMKDDMSDGLSNKLKEYDKEYLYYQKEYQTSLNTSIITNYNQLIEKYKSFDDKLETIKTPLVGYSSLMKAYYDAIDLYGYLKNSLMPTVEISGTTAADQIALLSSSTLSPISVKDAAYVSLASANSAILAYAKVIIDTSKYKIKVKDSSINGRTWSGSFTVTSYTDEENTADSSVITIIFNDNYQNFIKQQLDKTLAKTNTTDLSIAGLFKLEIAEFESELKKYSLSYLQNINDACQSCLDILIEQGIADENTWKYSADNLYESIYQPYYRKKNLTNNELALREKELCVIGGNTDEYGDITTKGLQQFIEEVRKDILSKLDFKNYVGEYWEEFCSFRRDDLWKNDNYISDGLSNSELFDKAEEFLYAAKKDIFKSANLQHSITSTLKNLLVMSNFEPIRESFQTGNWIRLSVDHIIYKLRLTDYEIDYENLDTLSVTFSDVTNTLSGISDIESIMKQSKSLSTSFDSVKRQAEQGQKSKELLEDWSENGFNTTSAKIVNDINQDIVYDKHGLLFRKFDTFSGTYSPIQMKIVNSILAFTTNNWETAQAGIGEFSFYNPKTQTNEIGYGVIANQLIGNLLLSKEVGIYNASGTLTFNENGLNITNGTNSFYVTPNDTSLLSIKKGETSIFDVDENGNLTIAGNFIAYDLELAPDVKIDISSLSGMDKFIQKDKIIGDLPKEGNTGFNVSSIGKLSASNATLYDTSIFSNTGKIGGFEISDGSLKNRDSNNRYSGMSLNDNFSFFAGGLKADGSDALFKVARDGSLYTSDIKVKNLLWVDEIEKCITIDKLNVTGNGLKVYGPSEQSINITSTNTSPTLLGFFNSSGKGRIGINKTGNMFIEPSKKLTIRSADSTDTQNINTEIDLVGLLKGTTIYSTDAWNQHAKCVVSSDENDISIKLNGNKLEFWINKKLFGSIPSTEEING